MAKNKLSFDAIFEGNDIKEDAKKRISAMLEDVVATRMEAHDDEDGDEDGDEDDDTEVVKEAKDRILIRGKVGGSAYEYVADPDKLGGSVDNKYERLTIKKQNPGLQPAAIDAIIAHLDNEDYDENGFESTEGQFKVTSSSEYMSNEAMDPTVDDKKDPEAEDEEMDPEAEDSDKSMTEDAADSAVRLRLQNSPNGRKFAAKFDKWTVKVGGIKYTLKQLTKMGADVSFIQDDAYDPAEYADEKFVMDIKTQEPLIVPNGNGKPIKWTSFENPNPDRDYEYKEEVSEMDPEAEDEMYEEDDSDPASLALSGFPELAKDNEFKQAFRALMGPDFSKLKPAFTAAFNDLDNNQMAKPFVVAFATILKFLAKDPTAVARLKSFVKVYPDPMTSADDGPINNEYSEAFTNKLDKYLTYVAEEWAENNKIALENGIKVQIAESFLSNMKGMYEQYNFTNIPTRDMVVELGTKVTEAEQKLNEQIEKNAQLRSKYNKQRKEMVVLESTKGLTVTQVEKFKKLTEDVAFEDEKSFKNKIAVIKENAFTKTVVKSDTKLETETGPQEELLHENTRMSKYVDTISRNLKY